MSADDLHRPVRFQIQEVQQRMRSVAGPPEVQAGSRNMASLRSFRGFEYGLGFRVQRVSSLRRVFWQSPKSSFKKGWTELAQAELSRALHLPVQQPGCSLPF